LLGRQFLGKDSRSSKRADANHPDATCALARRQIQQLVRVILIVNMSMIPQLLFAARTSAIVVRRSYFGPKRIEAEKHTVVKFRPTMDAIAFVYVDGQRRSYFRHTEYQPYGPSMPRNIFSPGLDSGRQSNRPIASHHRPRFGVVRRLSHPR
jgi:hypothetical protein